MSSSNPTILRYPGKVEIIIPAGFDWIMMLVLVIILAFWWITGGVIAINAIADERELDASDWVWATWGLAVMIILLRNILATLAGKERLSFSNGQMAIKRSLFSAIKVYDLAKAIRFEVLEADGDHSLFDGRLPDAEGAGVIRFHYLDRYIRIGAGLTASDALKLLTDLRAEGLLTEKNISKSIANITN